MTDFVNEGKSVPHTPSGADITAGDVLLIESKLLVAKHDIADGEEGTLAAQGVFDFPRTAATTYTAFKPVYWDVADQEATEDADGGTNKRIGYVVVGGAQADTTVRCYLVNDIAA